MNLFSAADKMIDTQAAAANFLSGAVFHKYVPLNVLMPESLFSTPPQEVDEDDCDTDTCHLDAPRPGTDRVSALAAYYQAPQNTENSAFVLNESEMADRMVDSLLNGNIDLKTPLGKVLSEMFIECMEETNEMPVV